jgi:hypothetical protein
MLTKAATTPFSTYDPKHYPQSTTSTSYLTQKQIDDIASTKAVATFVANGGIITQLPYYQPR